MTETTEWYSYTPIGVHYHAISPDDSVTSANEMSETKFSQLFEVQKKETLDALIHPGPAADDDLPCPDGWTERVRDILLDASISEEHMNAQLQRALKEGGLDGLESEEGATKVSEKHIRTLLGVCYEGNGIQETSVNGLPVSLQSRPDFAVWETTMLSCEGKHADKYELQDAIRQSAAYALVHLYYWMVKKSVLVRAVYGVAVAGTKCIDMTTGVDFTVVLLRLSLPRKIGLKLVLQKQTINNQTGSLADLWTFSRRVCRLERSDHRLELGQGCPALLTMPYELLSIHNPTRSSWTMIRNRTAALILRVDKPAGWNFIKQYVHAIPLRLEHWEEAIKKWIKYPLFLKSKNHLATHNPENKNFYEAATADENPLLVDLRDAYEAQPITTLCGIYILMADMGMALHESERFQGLDTPRLARKLHDLMKKVLGCQETCGIVHGDVHIGNVVYDSEKGVLRLIDYDEANFQSITRRTPRTPEQQRVHNDGLREDTVAYTKNQLINLFWVVWGRRDLPAGFASLRQEYDGTYEDGKRPDAETVHRIYNELCGNLETYNNEKGFEVFKSDLFEGLQSLKNPLSPRKTRSGRVLDKE